MEYIKTLYLDDAKIEEYNKLMAGPVDYDANDIKSMQTVESWTVNFPRGVDMDIKVCSGERRDDDPLWAEAVLYKGHQERDCSDVEDSLDTDFQCFIDDAHSYTVNVVPKSKPVKHPTIIKATRTIPADKMNAYEAMFTHNLITDKPAKSETAHIHSDWIVNFPKNIAVHIQVCSENGRMYARAVLRRKKRGAAPIYTYMRNTLKQPFNIYHDKILYTVTMEPRETAAGEENTND